MKILLLTMLFSLAMPSYAQENILTVKVFNKIDSFAASKPTATKFQKFSKELIAEAERGGCLLGCRQVEIAGLAPQVAPASHRSSVTHIALAAKAKEIGHTSLALDNLVDATSLLTSQMRVEDLWRRNRKTYEALSLDARWRGKTLLNNESDPIFSAAIAIAQSVYDLETNCDLTRADRQTATAIRLELSNYFGEGFVVEFASYDPVTGDTR